MQLYGKSQRVIADAINSSGDSRNDLKNSIQAETALVSSF